MPVTFVNQIIMYNLNQSILRYEDSFRPKANIRVNFLKSQDTCLKNSHNLTLFEIFFLFGSYLNLISKCQFRIFIKSVNFISVGTKVLDMLLDDLFYIQCIWLWFFAFTVCNLLFIFFVCTLTCWFAMIIMLLQKVIFEWFLVFLLI